MANAMLAVNFVPNKFVRLEFNGYQYMVETTPHTRDFPNVSLTSCFSHYTQCNWLQTQKLGLATAYKENDDLRLLVR